MNILVCISRVPDTATKIVIGGDRKSITPEGVKFIIGPYDEFAIEEALQLKKANGGEVTVVTVGTEKSQDVLRTALAMGADKAVILKTEEAVDSFFVAKNIADYAKGINPDLILLGRQSIDFDSFQMTSSLAELLDMPSVSVVSKLAINGDALECERDIEGGKETLYASLPCVISTQKDLNSPRYPKLPDIMKAKKKPIETIDATPVEARTELLDMELPKSNRKGIILSDSDEDIAKFVELIKG
ncbi:MAG: electron transfer flavoprotein subunit beta [Bacteroidetes bacterium 4572_77]|nr:MAG: electron transfer flavoprotein subunit beta [Bacteroidetes bacterium 4572_77]